MAAMRCPPFLRVNFPGRSSNRWRLLYNAGEAFFSFASASTDGDRRTSDWNPSYFFALCF